MATATVVTDDENVSTLVYKFYVTEKIIIECLKNPIITLFYYNYNVLCNSKYL